MSTKGKRDFRPLVHFTPEKNWSNDPNGLLYKDGVWHMYYQYYPDGPVHGPMHWGHAISRDLLHWEYLPIALYPDEIGVIFSGSMVYDENNTSGFGVDETTNRGLPNPYGSVKMPMIAMYTSHARGVSRVESQSIAYSLDGGIHFEKYYGNPVIPNPGIQDFRDPKAFWNKKKNCWSMVMAASDRCYFYASPDMKNWTKTGEFGPGVNKIPTTWECTDLIPFQTEEGEKWVVSVSMMYPGTNGFAQTQYFVGDFDGDTFVCTQETEEPLYVDFGPDNYAGVTWNGTDRPVFIAWGVNPAYANFAPTGEYAGMMTIARELSLVKTEAGYRLKAVPCGIDHLRAASWKIANESLLLKENFGLKVHGTSGAIVLENRKGQSLRVQVTEDTVTVDRSMAGANDFHEAYSKEEFSILTAKRWKRGDIDMEILFDVSYLEVFADGGLEAGSFTVYPDVPYNKIRIEGELCAEMYTLS